MILNWFYQSELDIFDSVKNKNNTAMNCDEDEDDEDRNDHDAEINKPSVEKINVVLSSEVMDNRSFLNLGRDGNCLAKSFPEQYPLHELNDKGDGRTSPESIAIAENVAQRASLQKLPNAPHTLFDDVHNFSIVSKADLGSLHVQSSCQFEKLVRIGMVQIGKLDT
ncbi:hypothetical protein AVEN_232445-1 [Araneus ventricosus]|uniref:Uncharacterized protein n=1 Tax=Araneus ventricosus TaxID=182803 RepID=A0A4Y2TUT3_ARAVE|nr:hypothetical protein AVEN_232445-1 [Araneus ventricosus]